MRPISKQSSKITRSSFAEALRDQFGLNPGRHPRNFRERRMTLIYLSSLSGWTRSVALNWSKGV